tara:strand:- start:45 stop:743 length:699 start_codon:yes stop_codon:yes gene_type:complete
MADILPIDPAKLNEEPIEPVETNIKIEIEEPLTPILEDDDEIDKEVKVKKQTIFEVPKEEEPVVISKITGKPKRKCSEKKLLALKKAQQASRLKRAANKEQKDLEKAGQRLELQKRKQEKLDKKLESDTTLELRQQIYLEEVARAQKDTVWDTERLTNLMNNTINNYITEKKKQKPVPKAFIPAQQAYPQYTPQQQPSQPQQTYYQPPPQPQYTYKQPSNNNVMNDLFGFNG